MVRVWEVDRSGGGYGLRGRVSKMGGGDGLAKRRIRSEVEWI